MPKPDHPRRGNVHQAQPSRRKFLRSTAAATAAGAALASRSIPAVHAAENGTLSVALVGCGGRGTGAAVNALSVPGQSVRLVAMADVFESKVENKAKTLADVDKVSDRVEVPKERRFVGFDAYRQAMDCLQPGDIVILTTPPVFRWVHYRYAIEKGLHVFMEKPLTVDGPTTVKLLELNQQALAKNLKVGVGLMCRHCEARQELFDRIQNGEIGDLNLLRAYRMTGPTGSAACGPPQPDENELLYQINHFHGFLWLSGGAVSDFLIHNIDEACWMKDDWPVDAIASGGRHYRGNNVDQNFDHYSIEYTFADGAKLYVDGRTMPGCKTEFATYAHGSKGMAVVSTASHTPAKSRIYRGHLQDNAQLQWAFPQPEPNPYQLEWNNLVSAIRQDLPFNEVERGAMASIVTSMGRMAAHTGQQITLDQMMNHPHEFAPDVDQLTIDSPSPLQANEDGKYPLPMPGILKDREYA